MKKVVWDWNGTLLDDVDLCFDCINKLLTKYDKDPLETLEDYRNVFGFPIQDYYQRVGFDFDVTPWDMLANEYMDDYMDRSTSCKLTPYAWAALKMVKKGGADNFILSASSLDNLVLQIGWHHLAGVVDGVFGIHDIYAHSKIDLARQFKATCLPEDEIWVIGDTLHDAEVAREIGAKCILVQTGHHSKKRLLRSGFPVVEGPRQAIELLELNYEGSNNSRK